MIPRVIMNDECHEQAVLQNKFSLKYNLYLVNSGVREHFVMGPELGRFNCSVCKCINLGLGDGVKKRIH